MDRIPQPVVVPRLGFSHLIESHDEGEAAALFPLGFAQDGSSELLDYHLGDVEPETDASSVEFLSGL